MFLRAFRICCPEFVDREFLKIYDVGTKLKYPKFLIDKSLQTAKKVFYSNECRGTFNNENILALPFNLNFTYIQKLLKTFKINVIFKNSGTLKSLLINNSPKQNYGCIYTIPCNGCDMRYLGQTGKILDCRIKQHKYAVRTGQISNALFIHMNNNNHIIDWKSSSEIVICNNIIKRNIIESAFIKYFNHQLLNLSLGLFKLDCYLVNQIVRQYNVNF